MRSCFVGLLEDLLVVVSRKKAGRPGSHKPMKLPSVEIGLCSVKIIRVYSDWRHHSRDFSRGLLHHQLLDPLNWRSRGLNWGP